MPPMSPVQRRMIEAAGEVMPTDRPGFLHAALCQLGLPRRRMDGETFERTSGNASIRLRAGELWDGRAWVSQPLPYGVKPRLALVHVSSEAVRTRNPVVEVGSSIREFLGRLGLGAGGREYSRFQQQMRALAAVEMRLGIGAKTLKAQPIKEFDAWLHPTGAQRTLWPGTITLSPDFFDGLVAAAVPLDPRALAALRHSSLSMDTYTWLAHRLHRVRAPGERVSWEALQGQFGQEYAEAKVFNRDMRKALRDALVVYRDARLEEVPGGVLLRPSPPPVPKLVVGVVTVDKSGG